MTEAEHRKTNIAQAHLHVASKAVKPTEADAEQCLPRARADETEAVCEKNRMAVLLKLRKSVIQQPAYTCSVYFIVIYMTVVGEGI